MKNLSFSINQSSKPSNSVPRKHSQTFDDSDSKDTEGNSISFVTEFNAGDQTPAAKPSVAIIPPLPNTWDCGRVKTMKNLDLPITAPSEWEVPYGLTLRNRPEKTKNRVSAEDAQYLQRLRYDLARLPEHGGMAEFEEIPVEGFGLAILAGYGWKKGDGIGKNAKKDVKSVEYTRRHGDRQGLGFVKKGRVLERFGNIDLSEKKKKKKKGCSAVEENWVARGIRVGVVSRELRGGAVYLKKGSVVDVVGPGECDVAMEEGREVLQRVSQEALEKVVPRLGGRVLVLLGERKGVYGSLVERDSELGKGVVRNEDTHEMVDVGLDQIAEFVGDPSELGY